MRDEYDFSKGQRGRFFRADATLTPPVHLDPDVLDWSVKTGRIIVSRDASTLIAEHDEVVARGTWTPGLLIVRKGFSIPEVVEYLSLVSHVGGADEFSCKRDYIPK